MVAANYQHGNGWPTRAYSPNDLRSDIESCNNFPDALCGRFVQDMMITFGTMPAMFDTVIFPATHGMRHSPWCPA